MKVPFIRLISTNGLLTSAVTNLVATKVVTAEFRNTTEALLGQKQNKTHVKTAMNWYY